MKLNFKKRRKCVAKKKTTRRRRHSVRFEIVLQTKDEARAGPKSAARFKPEVHPNMCPEQEQQLK